MKRLAWYLVVVGLLYVGPVLLSVQSQPAEMEILREPEYSKRIAQQFRNEGKAAATEVVLPDGSRVDVMTDDVAYEVEWAGKWKESIGQAVLYGLASNRRPGIVLLLKGEPGEDKNYLRALAVAGSLGIQLEVRRIGDL